jgi:hypothetical protein
VACRYFASVGFSWGSSLQNWYGLYFVLGTFATFVLGTFATFVLGTFATRGIFSSRLCALSLSRAWLGKPRVIAFIGASFLNKKEAVLHRAQIREWASAEGKLFVASVRTYHIETQSDRRVFHCRRERERGVVVPVGPD